MKSSLESSQVAAVLAALYADAAVTDPLARKAARESGRVFASEADHYRAMATAYMPVDREFGKLLHGLALGMKARTIVEFGTSFGISTIFLACALRDLGAGKVVTTEFEPAKAERAQANLAAAGLEEWMEIRVGDALETLADPPAGIDLVLLDGAKGLYLEVLRMLEPSLRPGAVIASDNTDHDGLGGFLGYLRDPANGYVSAAILTGDPRDGRGHEISVRVV